MKKAKIIHFGDIHLDQEGDLVLSGFIYESNDQENRDQRLVLLEAAIDWLQKEHGYMKSRIE
jgi:hypothetical protein